ncbi:flagellar biosynthesis anti-sigma factor FlgM [Fervidobacterium thailandense]|uniref:Negative regulator of flagellin synthesis n=1 Tax=Fervidobacterium thailandense TaxID=1008305 RepID=A0A1E3G4G3_9BACT|nr:flagellar biosynthesis anti-sigma factor FlgM [Fervidobacterium thailandense]ODN31072.1 flagellar biosynthesis anti-sigma factor FlgM [Fervidobacterium thailandense]
MIDRVNRAGQMQGAQHIQETKGKEAKKGEKLREKEEKEALLIEDGKKVAEYIAMAKNYPEVRTELVQKLKEAIENGTFKIDVDKIARKLLGE